MDTRRRARWSTPAQARIVLFSCLVWAASAGCNEDDSKVTSIEVAVRSDFRAGDELSFVYVESLSANEEDVVQRAWLELDADCANGMEGARLLGSIRVDRREDDTAHLRLRGYHRSSGGKAELIAERRVDLRFDGGARATVELLRTCAATPGDCDGGLCLPSTCTKANAAVTGTERAQGLEDCLSLATIEPVVALPDAGVVIAEDATAPPTPAAVCGDDDGTCPDDCTRFEDADCTLHLGDACHASSECDSGLSCADGVCCESSCDAECFRCDLPSSAGYCRDVTVAREAPINAGTYEASCTEKHVSVRAFPDGSARVECFPGFSQCAPAESYAALFAQRGCDTALGTPDDCGSCGDSCKYGVCSEGTCAADAQGILSGSSEALLSGDAAIGAFVNLTPLRAARALGALVDPGFSVGSLRLALYGDLDGSFAPDELLAVTAELSDVTRDALDASFSTRNRTWARVEGMLTSPVVVDASRSYFIFVWASSDTYVWRRSDTILSCSTSAPRGSFPQQNSQASCADDRSMPSVYAVVTP
jgi:hypothetical protein